MNDFIPKNEKHKALSNYFPSIYYFSSYNHINSLDEYFILPDDMIELVFILKGEVIVQQEGKELILKAGDLFILNTSMSYQQFQPSFNRASLCRLVLQNPGVETGFLGLQAPFSTELYKHISGCMGEKVQLENTFSSVFRKLMNFECGTLDMRDILLINNQLVALLLHVLSRPECRISRVYSPKIEQSLDLIRLNIYEQITLESLASKVELSVSRFKHLFRKEVGTPPSEYIVRQKLQIAKKAIESSEESIKHIAYDLGFSSPSYFSKVFRQYYGVSPNAMKEKCEKCEALELEH